MNTEWLTIRLMDFENPADRIDLELPEIPRVGEYVEHGRDFWKVVGIVHRANVPGRVPVLYAVREPDVLKAITQTLV